MHDRFWLYLTAVAVTLVVIYASLIHPDLVASERSAWWIGFVLLLGIPHGATDHLIYEELRGRYNRPRLLAFCGLYALSIGLYALCWHLFPLAALALFMWISFFHFGQSNWAHFYYEQQWNRWLHYVLWGIFILLTPVLWHLDTVRPVIAEMTGWHAPAWPPAGIALFLLILLTLNLGLIGLSYRAGRIDARGCLQEATNLLLLLLLFLVAPLLWGFAIYFVFWHAIPSMLEQVAFFNYNRWSLPSPGWPRVGWRWLPIIATLILLALYIPLGSHLQQLVPDHLALGFILLTLLTLPHMLLVDRLYERWGVG